MNTIAPADGDPDSFDRVSVPALLRLRDALFAYLKARMDRDERAALAERAAGEAHNARLHELATTTWRPVLHARRLDDGRVAAWCPLCRADHIHRGEGSRQPHCPEGTGNYVRADDSYRVVVLDDEGGAA